MNLKRKVSGIILSCILCSNFFVSSAFANGKNIEYKLGNNIIKTEKKLDDNMIKINLPKSNFGTFYIKNTIDSPEKTTFILGYEKFKNVNTNKKYIILRDETNKVIKAYNTKQLVFTDFDLHSLGLNDKYSYGEVVILNSDRTNIKLKSKKEDANVYAKTKEVESQNTLIFNYEDSKNPDALVVNLKFTINNMVVKELKVKVDKNNRPNIKEVEYQGKKYKINNMILPIITETATITIPIDTAFLGPNIVHTEEEQNAINKNNNKNISTIWENKSVENSNTVNVYNDTFKYNAITVPQNKKNIHSANKKVSENKQWNKKIVLKQKRQNTTKQNNTNKSNVLPTIEIEKSNINKPSLIVEEKIKDKSIVNNDVSKKPAKEENNNTQKNKETEKNSNITTISKTYNDMLSSRGKNLNKSSGTNFLNSEIHEVKEKKMPIDTISNEVSLKQEKNNTNVISYSAPEDTKDKSLLDSDSNN